MNYKIAVACLLGILAFSACAQGAVRGSSRIGGNEQATRQITDVELQSQVAETKANQIEVGEFKASATPTPGLSPTRTPTKTTQPTLTASKIPTPIPTLPEEHAIRFFYGHRQYFPLGCEASVAVDWASYFGVEINEFEFQYNLPVSDNPDIGFVGSVEDPWGQVPPYSYGVHAEPVAALLREYGLNAEGIKGYTLEQLKIQITHDQPIIAWVIGNVVGGVPYEYTDKEGNKTIVAAYEHVVVVTGYDQDMIRYNNNGRYYEIPVDVFLNSWSILGNMVIVMGDHPQELICPDGHC